MKVKNDQEDFRTVFREKHPPPQLPVIEDEDVDNPVNDDEDVDNIEEPDDDHEDDLPF